MNSYVTISASKLMMPLPSLPSVKHQCIGQPPPHNHKTPQRQEQAEKKTVNAPRPRGPVLPLFYIVYLLPPQLSVRHSMSALPQLQLNRTEMWQWDGKT